MNEDLASALTTAREEACTSLSFFAERFLGLGDKLPARGRLEALGAGEVPRSSLEAKILEEWRKFRG
jgi:hypothetical protein